MSSTPFESLFGQMFTGQLTEELRREDYDKAKALISVISKSEASISDVVKLANALNLNLTVSASSKPKPKDTEPENGPVENTK